MNIQENFERFHRENPHVYKLFEDYSYQALRRGYKKFSAKAVFERLRWYIKMETVGEDFKLNNNYTAHYARKLMRENPEFAGFFDLRERKS